MSACPDENQLAQLAENTISAEHRAWVERHLDECNTCTQLVAELAALAVPARSAPDRYRIIRRLGAGGMGEVWEAEDTQLNRRVALKFVRAIDAADGTRQNRLVREARAVAQLRDPNVIAVHDVGQHGDEVFVAMELVDGSDARAWRGTAERSEREILAVWRQAALGLAAVHRAGIVHRDIKPENVLVASDGRVVISDFGLATGELGGASLTLTVTGAVVGTPLYMSPEQLHGESATPRSDQFALCVCIWEALTGDRPYRGATLASLAVAMLEPLQCPPGRDRAVFSALCRGLDPDPAKRWPDVTTLLAAIDLPVSPPRKRRALMMVTAGIVAAAAGGVAIGWRMAPGRGEPPAASQQAAAMPGDAPSSPVTTASIDTGPPPAVVEPSTPSPPAARPATGEAPAAHAGSAQVSQQRPVAKAASGSPANEQRANAAPGTGLESPAQPDAGTAAVSTTTTRVPRPSDPFNEGYCRACQVAVAAESCRIPTDFAHPGPNAPVETVDWGTVTSVEIERGTFRDQESREIVVTLRGQRGTYRFSPHLSASVLTTQPGALLAICVEDRTSDMSKLSGGPVNLAIAAITLHAPPNLGRFPQLKAQHIRNTIFLGQRPHEPLHKIEASGRYLLHGLPKSRDGNLWDMGLSYFLDVPPGTPGAAKLAPKQVVWFVAERPEFVGAKGEERMVVHAVAVLDEIFP